MPILALVVWESVERERECWQVSESGGRERVPHPAGGCILAKILIANLVLGCVGKCGKEGE